MKTEHFEALSGRLLDDELSPAEGDELAAILRAEPQRRRELRQHLVLWELWVQHQAPERSAEAFVAACRTRLRAERQGENFLARLKERISSRSTSLKIPTHPATWRETLLRPASLAWAASLIFVVATTVFWLQAFHRTAAMTIVQGEAVCPACVLHEGHVHVPAVRVRKNGVTLIYYLDPSPSLSSMQGYFCGGPTPVKVEGRTHREGGQMMLNVSHIELPLPTKQ